MCVCVSKQARLSALFSSGDMHYYDCRALIEALIHIHALWHNNLRRANFHFDIERQRTRFNHHNKKKDIHKPTATTPILHHNTII